jgi:DNA ligase-1
VDDEWERVKFMSIEPMIAPPPCIVPRPRGHDGVFRLIPQIVCRGPDHLQEFYDGIVEGGGEGVVLRHPNQPYHAGRSPYLVKVKPEVKAIAQVVGYNYDGAHLKSLQCAWNPDTRTPEPPKRVLFDLSNGLTEATRQSPPAEGKRITIVFQSLTPEGKPQFAKITR